jgi:flavodoxin
MKIGIIIHSLTGNTLSVAEKLQAALTAQGHTVELKRVTAVNETPNSRNSIALENAPSITAYDAVIFGAPVRGYSLSPVMNLYLKQLQALTGKKVAGFVTEHFPKPWMGGNHSIKQMVRLIAQKGGKIMDTGVVNWTNKVREEQIKDIVVRFCKTI